ncbi:MAG TPA: hypothetical protein VLK66_07520 [Longimicrobium sp.]|nr:hypothetical protein [Longimicrobium sp.]
MDSQLLQTFIVGLIVLAAAFFIGRRAWRTVSAARAPKGGSGGTGCGSDCGCGH